MSRALILALIVMLAFAVRALTANFIRAHFDDPSWFQAGSYDVFDRQAQAALDGKEPFFSIPDASRTDLIQYPPGNRFFLAAIYAVGGQRSAVAVQRVQVVLDSLSVLLVVGLAAAVYGWNAGLVAGFLAALSPALALGAAAPGPDPPATWAVLGALWLFMLSARHRKILYAIAAGGVLGVACWIRVNPFLLFIVWAVSILLFVPASWRLRMVLSSALALATLIVMSPVLIRNLVVFYPQVAPTGLNVGLNLWEGIGETSRGPEFGAPGSDRAVLEQDRKEMGLPPDAPLSLNYPDGIRRDRERAHRALTVIKAHPFWFAGTMAHRLWGHLKLAGNPVPHVGSTGINVTSRKCLGPDNQGGILAFAVNCLGMVQSVLRYLMLPLILTGIWLAWRQNSVGTLLLLCTVAYYLATLAVGHSEIRYGFPMQVIFIVFAAVAMQTIATQSRKFWQLRRGRID